MLYDPKWEKHTETKADPFTLESLIAWLEKQPAEKSYNFNCVNGTCLAGQYFRATIGKLPGDWWSRFMSFTGGSRSYIATREPWNFGAALERARQFAAE